MQTFKDVFDTSGIELLNAQIGAAKTLEDLPPELGKAAFAIPEGIKNITPGQIAAFYKEKIELTATEVDMLLKNDSKTYIDVINRFGSMPAGIGTLGESDFKELKAGALNKYLVKQVIETDNFYSTDYYSAILAFQDYMKKAVIKPLENLDQDEIFTSGSGNAPAGDPYVVRYKLISMNNTWEMWWAYWSDGTRTKHKGAIGSSPF